MGLDNQSPQSTDNQVGTGQSNQTLGQRANEILRNAQLDENNNVIIPEDTPTELREFVNLEKQRRDTQTAYTKGQQENATLKAEKDALLTKVGGGAISTEDQQMLETLKYEDPDKWYVEKQRLEGEARQSAQTSLQDTMTSAASTAQEAYQAQEMKRREKILSDFTTNSGINLTEDTITNDVPPRIQNKLKEGMEFGAWLYEVAEYLKSPKVVENEKIENVPNIGGQGSGGEAESTDYGTGTIY